MKTYRRSRLELYLDVLKAIGRGQQSPSRIVYAANLSYDRVIRCINFLEERGLVQTVEHTKRRFCITENGNDVLRYFESLKNKMGFLGPPKKKSEKQTAFIPLLE